MPTVYRKRAVPPSPSEIPRWLPTELGNIERALGQQWQPLTPLPVLNAAATDLATVIALTNQIRAALIASGVAT